MSSNFKILDGTPKSGKSLCLSCASMSRRISQDMEEQVFCANTKISGGYGSHGPRIVPFKVAECSEYRAFTSQSLTDMYDMAWSIQARKKGPVGFTGPLDSTNSTLEYEIVPPKPYEDD
jgi:hypothetical protein